jgi:protein transport protein SEC61 subunit alpha
MGFRLFKLLAPAVSLFPSVSTPMNFISTREKTVITAITLFIYLLCCQIPLYGVLRAEGSDPFYWMRVILASNRGTLMELGLSPVISAGWILQILVGLRVI